MSGVLMRVRGHLEKAKQGRHITDHSGCRIAMDRDTFEEFASELLSDPSEHASSMDAAALDRARNAFSQLAKKHGDTGFPYRGAMICIVPWIDGFALFRERRSPPLARLLQRGR